MYTGVKQRSNPTRILVIRLGAMGDIIHALPAVASLKNSFPGSELTWAVEPRWAPLLEGNPSIDRLIFVDRTRAGGLLTAVRELRKSKFDLAIDFQGLFKSALVAFAARPDRTYGFHKSQLREPLAGLFYSDQTPSNSTHVVDRNLDLVVSAGGATVLRIFPLPRGKPEGLLPDGGFVLASPLGGWTSKQWPLEQYQLLSERLRRYLGLPLVLNEPQNRSIAGLIHATRRATAIVGIDSGPLHLAAALGKPGVAIFGPTDPARNGPYGGSIKVLRSPLATTSYKRGAMIHPSMEEISAEDVFQALSSQLTRASA